MNSTGIEKKTQTSAIILTVLIHAAILLAMMFTSLPASNQQVKPKIESPKPALIQPKA